MKSEQKLFQGKTLAILSGGGDTPAINSSIEAVRNRASCLGYQVYGIRHGWKGLLGDGDVLNLSQQTYNGVYGGTALRSSRTNPFPSGKNPENRVPQILRNIERYKIDVLVSIGGDDTNGAAKRLYETEGIPVIGFPKTIDNDLRTFTKHHYQGQTIDSVVCPGFPSAVKGVMEYAARIRTTAESHSRIMVIEVMGRDAGWLTGGAAYGGAELALVPEVEMTRERKEAFFDKVKEMYLNSAKKSLVIAVSEGVRWYNDATGLSSVVYASSELDEYGHSRFGGVSGMIAAEISKETGIEARSEIAGYYARSGECQAYDRKLTTALADKVSDFLLRQEYGRMPVLNRIVTLHDLEEFNTSSIDMGDIGNQSLPAEYYDAQRFNFSNAYHDFLSYILGKPNFPVFDYHFPVVTPSI
jgi:ATP-dependent phosphofructokinase / diphosphate-dependent phosphofructokinase